MLRVLELFSGSKAVARAFEGRGHEVVTLDTEWTLEPTVCCDIRYALGTVLDERYGPFDLVWASPPCEKYSTLTYGRNWRVRKGHPPQPRTAGARVANDIVRHTLHMIRVINPRWWVMENPLGALRAQPFMQDIPRRTVTWCQYGHHVRKPTDLWGRPPASLSFRACKPGSPCHEPVPRNLACRGGVIAMKNARERAALPGGFCDELVAACERDMGVVLRAKESQ